jgi:hypothetical protein
MRNLNRVPSRCTVERIRRLGSRAGIEPEFPTVAERTAARPELIRGQRETLSGTRLTRAEKCYPAGGENLEEPTTGLHMHLTPTLTNITRSRRARHAPNSLAHAISLRRLLN